jgi:hypothetical protein
MYRISDSEALARLRCLGQLIVGHKTLQRECNKVRDIAQLTQAQLKHRHSREHMFGPLLRGSQTFLHTRHLLFDPHNVINKGEKHAVEKEGERR